MFQDVKFAISAASLSACPSDSVAEIAFAGRSNAGKSSALNALTGNRSLARTSKTPGRTQLLNFFALGDHRYLVDLPGYGYAKVPMSLKNRWQRDMAAYLRHREALTGLVLLCDIRHDLKDTDRTMIDWASDANLPLHLMLTKADKINRGAAHNALLAVGQLTRQHPRMTAQLFSATRQQGVAEAHALLMNWFASRLGKPASQGRLG